MGGVLIGAHQLREEGGAGGFEGWMVKGQAEEGGARGTSANCFFMCAHTVLK